MTELQTRPVSPPPEAGDHDLTRELRQIEKRDWWVWGYSIFVMLLLTFAVITFTLPLSRQDTKTLLNLKLDDAVFGLIVLIILLNLYTIYQQVLIKRLRLQLAEKQGHSDILRNMAMVDPLTGLYNRRFGVQRLAAEVARSERRGHPLTVLTLDLNDFKLINDRHGHPAGDHVLQEFAAHLNKVIRGSDMAVRLGGDEFLVLLPECALDQLQLVLDRLGALEVTWQSHRIPVSFSAGWQQYSLGDRPEELLARADQALYTGKRASKNPSSPAARIESVVSPVHLMVDVTCPHCQKKNSVALDAHSAPTHANPWKVQCAHCKLEWEPLLPGPIMAGPFPK
jgi:diguanylate cyclase (GGDEF)-like protein